MAEQFWRIRRWREREAQVMDYDDGETGVIALTKIMPVVQRLMSAAERGFHKTLATLRQVQKDRGFVPHFSATCTATDDAAVSADSGFVPQNNPSANSELLQKYSPATVAWWNDAVAHGDFLPEEVDVLDMMEADLGTTREKAGSDLRRAA